MKKNLISLIVIAVMSNFIGCGSDSGTSPTNNNNGTGFSFGAFFNPAAGDTFSFHNVDTNSLSGPGNSGSGVTWNFSGITVNPDTSGGYYLAPSATPYGSSFPGATLSFHPGFTGTSFGFYKTSSSVNEELGLASAAFTLVFSDPMSLQLPINYQGNQQDAYRGTYTAAGMTHVYKGVSTWDYDGVGTLTLPNGVSYTNVARIHHTDTSSDSSLVQFTTVIDNYQWYRSDYKFPVFNYNTVTTATSVKRNIWINRTALN